MQVLLFFIIPLFGVEVYFIPVALDSAQASVSILTLAFAIDTHTFSQFWLLKWNTDPRSVFIPHDTLTI